MELMAQETLLETERAGDWKMLIPAMDDSFDKFYAPQRVRAYQYIRQFINGKKGDKEETV